MTPQLQQFFGAPPGGGGVIFAAPADTSQSDLASMDLRVHDEVCGFAEMIKDVTEDMVATAALPQTLPLPIKLGTQAVMATLMQSQAIVPDGAAGVAVRTSDASLPGQEKDRLDTAIAYIASLATGAAQISAAAMNIKQVPVVCRVADGEDATSPAVVRHTVVAAAGDIKAAESHVPLPALFAPVPFPATDDHTPGAPQVVAYTSTTTAFATAMTGPEIQQPPTLATADNAATVNVASISKTELNTGFVTQAESAFNLRAAGADAAAVVIAPRQLGLVSGPAMLALGGPDAANAVTAKPAVDDFPPSDSAALPPFVPASDQLPTAQPITGADLQKPHPTAPAQPNPTPPAAPPVAVTLPPSMSADLVSLLKTPPNGPVEILLNPEELGHLRFEIHQKADQLRVILSAENPETIDLLRRNADQLLAEFRTAGFSGASLSFGQWNQNGGNSRSSPDAKPSRQPWAYEPRALPVITHPSQILAAPTGLNMRL